MEEDSAQAVVVGFVQAAAEDSDLAVEVGSALVAVAGFGPAEEEDFVLAAAEAVGQLVVVGLEAEVAEQSLSSETMPAQWKG